MTDLLRSEATVRMLPERAGFSLISGAYHANFDWFRRALTHKDIWFFTTGKGHAIFKDGRHITVRRGLVLLLKKGDELEFFHHEDDETLRTYYFHFDLLKPKGASPRPELRLPQILELGDTAFYEATFKRILFLLQGASVLNADIHEAAISNATRLFESTLRQLEFEHALNIQNRLTGIETHQQHLISDLVGKMYEHPERFWDGDEIQKVTGYCRDHLARIFRRVTGKTTRQILIDARLEKARRLLRNTNLSIAQISDEIGYENQFYFCRQFKAVTGFSPSVFRRT